MLGAELRGPGGTRLTRLDSLDRADERTLSFVRESRYVAEAAAGRAGALLVSRSAVEGPYLLDTLLRGGTRSVLIVPDADGAVLRLLRELADDPLAPPQVMGHRSVHPEARVDPTAHLGAHVVVGPRSVIGAGSIVHANAVIGADVTIGERTVLHASVVVQDRCVIGSGCIVHPGVVIGADGFGYRPSPDGRGIDKIPHVGNVTIGDLVEIGANTCIDRGKFGATRIGDMTKIDNLVQIGHNCTIGRGCLICGGSGLAGSVTLQDGVTLGGGVGIADGVTIGRGAGIGAMSGVMHDVPPGETWAGLPARPSRQAMRIFSAMDQLPELVKRAKKLMEP